MNYKFILRADRQHNGRFPLYCRGIFDRKKKDISLKISLNASQFHPEKEIVINHPDAVPLNLKIEKIKFRLKQEVYNCMVSETDFNPELFEQIIKGKVTNRNSFYEFALNEIDNSPELSKEYKRTYKSQVTKLKQFKPELTWKEMTIDFIEKYKTYMLLKLGNCENTCFKSLSVIKSIVNRAIKKEIVTDNVFKNITFKKTPGRREFLSIEDLKTLETLLYSGKLRRNQPNILRYFLFSCYTGLRYYDVKTLTYDQIKEDIIALVMHKTKDYVRIPLIDKARSLIDSEVTNGKIFKVLTNQKTNSNLKEIMDIAGIQKTISFHCASILLQRLV